MKQVLPQHCEPLLLPWAHQDNREVVQSSVSTHVLSAVHCRCIGADGSPITPCMVLVCSSRTASSRSAPLLSSFCCPACPTQSNGCVVLVGGCGDLPLVQATGGWCGAGGQCSDQRSHPRRFQRDPHHSGACWGCGRGWRNGLPEAPSSGGQLLYNACPCTTATAGLQCGDSYTQDDSTLPPAGQQQYTPTCKITVWLHP